MADLVGKTLSGKYRVDAFIGRGGMSDVYKIWDVQRSVYLAMKVLHEDLAEDKVFLRRFRREAQTLGRLQHPNIVRFYGLEQDARLAFILMDYVEGHSLRQEIFDAPGPFPLQRVLEILRPVCAALSYAHSKGFVHCDVKPANILIDNAGRIQLSDFGIARMTEAATVTMVGSGTPAYMSPEQARGENPAPPSDIYSLGVVLYEMLTGGERPFTGEHARITGSTGEKIRWEQANLLPPSPRKHDPGMTSELEAIVLKCLEKNPERRFKTPLEFVTDLERAITGIEEGKAANKVIEKQTADELVKSKAHIAESTPVALSAAPRRQRKINPLSPVGRIPPLPQNLPDRFPVVGGITVIFLLAAISLIIVLTSRNHQPFIRRIYNQIGAYDPSSDLGRAAAYSSLAMRLSNNIAGSAESWGPVPVGDGNVYFTSNLSGKAEIYDLNPNGQTIRITTTPGSAESWGPVPVGDGNVYFTSNLSGKAEIYDLNSNGQTIRITTTPGLAESWGPVPVGDGNVYFTSNLSGKAEIYDLNPNGQIIKITTMTAQTGWLP